MPQCHHSTNANTDSTAFGKNSRYMKANAFNLSTLRRVKALNVIEQRYTRMKMSVAERHRDIELKARSYQRVNILESYKRTLAYKLVVRNHPIRKAPDFKKALDQNYSYHSLRNEIKQMLIDIKPDEIEKKAARKKISENYDQYQSVISQNQARIMQLCPKKKPVQEIVPESRSPTPPPAPDSFSIKRGVPLRGLARVAQAVTLKMVKERSWAGNGPASSPTKTQTPHPSKSLNPHNKLPPIAAEGPGEVGVLG